MSRFSRAPFRASSARPCRFCRQFLLPTTRDLLGAARILRHQRSCLIIVAKRKTPDDRPHGEAGLLEYRHLPPCDLARWRSSCDARPVKLDARERQAMARQAPDPVSRRSVPETKRPPGVGGEHHQATRIEYRVGEKAVA